MGVTFEDLLGLERLVDIKIVVLNRIESGDSFVEWTSDRIAHGLPLVLNLYRNHYSLVRGPDAFTNSYMCPTCDR